MESGPPSTVVIGPGTVLRDRWRLDSLLARGRTSAVYSATHRNSRRFAIKVMDPRLAEDAQRRERWVKHAYLANAIPHEGVIHTVDDDVVASSLPFTVMDLVDGETLLARWQAEGRRLRPSHVVEIVLAVLEILAAAHAHRILHGALSLEHVILQRGGRIRLCGFGSNSDDNVLAESIKTLAVDVGTAGFVAPEQALGTSELSERSDVYGVAAMALALLTGSFALDVAARAFADSLPSLAAELSVVFDRALSFDPGQRWPTAIAMREALTNATSQAVRIKTGPRAATDPVKEAIRRKASSESPGDASTPALPAQARPISEVAHAGQWSADATSASAISNIGRGTTVLALAMIDASLLGGLTTRAGASGMRLEPVASGALLVPPALASAREEAHLVAGFALDLARTWPSLGMELITGVELLTHHRGANAALNRVFAAPKASDSKGRIRLDDETARLVERLFEIAEYEGDTILIGERTRGHELHQVLGRPIAFVGRQPVAREIVDAIVAGIAERSARALLVVAPSGFGKSRLTEEVARRIAERASGVEIWSVTGDATRREVAFGIIGDIVDRAASTSRSEALDDRRRAISDCVKRAIPPAQGAAEVVRITEFLAELAGAGFAEKASPAIQLARRDAASMGDQMRFAFLDFLSSTLERGPFAIVVEDLELADSASVELLGHALTLLKQKPWSLLATARPEIDQVFPRVWKSARKELEGLGRDELANIARQAIGETSEYARADIESLAELANGSPLYLEELLRSRAEGGAWTRARDVRELLRERVAALDPALSRVLSAASVYGTEFSLASITALFRQADSTEDPPSPELYALAGNVSTALEALCARELIVPRPEKRRAGGYAFRHALVREIAYQRLSANEAAVAHRTAGAFLERQGEREASVLADHFSRANAESEAAAWYDRSAADALERNDIVSALDLATRGLGCDPRPDLALSLLTTRAECQVWRAEYQEARATAARVVDGAAAGSLMWCRALVPLATGLTRGGDPSGSIALAERLLTNEAEVADERAIAGAMAALIGYLLRLGRADLVRSLMARLADFVSDPHVELATKAYAESAASWCAMFAGDFSDCLRHDREAVRCFHEAGDARNACRETASIGYDLMVLGMYEDAETAFRAALTQAERLGIARVVANAKHHLTLITLRLGRVEEARRFGLDALELGRSSADPFAIGSMRVYLALVMAASGDEEGAARALEEAVAEFAVTPSGQAWPLAELGRVRLAQGRVEEALRHAEAAMAVLSLAGPAEEGDAVIRLTHAEVLAACGRIDEARSAVERALRRLQERANRILDTTLKQSFLHRVPEHALTISHALALGIAV